MDSDFCYLKEALASANSYTEETMLMREFLNNPDFDPEDLIFRGQDKALDNTFDIENHKRTYQSNLRLSWSKYNSLN